MNLTIVRKMISKPKETHVNKADNSDEKLIIIKRT